MKIIKRAKCLAEYLSQRLEIQSNGCWNFTGYIARHGYGTTTQKYWKQYGKFLAHQLTYILYKGPIPENMCVCHTCDNRICCNPAHLFLGTQNDNVQDKVKKHRNFVALGEKQHLSKLTEEKVRIIRNSIHSAKQLSQMFGVSIQAIHYVRKRQTWKHIA